MADTLITKDGKLHVLVGSTTLESIVREYAGDDVGNRVHNLIETLPDDPNMREVDPNGQYC